MICFMHHYVNYSHIILSLRIKVGREIMKSCDKKLLFIIPERTGRHVGWRVSTTHAFLVTGGC